MRSMTLIQRSNATTTYYIINVRIFDGRNENDDRDVNV